MRNFRTIHRVIATIIVIVTLYLSVTGLLIQGVDLRAIFKHVPASDPDMQAIRESFNGPPNYEVLSVADFTAQALPAGAAYDAMLQRVLQTARQALGQESLRYVELRVLDGKPLGILATEKEVVQVDATTGELIHRAAVQHEHVQQPPSLRNQLKWLHRMTPFGNYALYINVIVGAGLILMVLSGVALYWKMMQERGQGGLKGLFWVGGERKLDDWKRAAHRWSGLISSALLMVIAVSGLWLAVESLYFGFYLQRMIETHTMSSFGANRDVSAPLVEAELPAMLQVTLQAEHAKAQDEVVKVVRLRYYAGMPQGLVIVGEGDHTRQIVFEARQGRALSLTEPGYPTTGFPFGWQAHETAKNVHRGDILGMPGRYLDILGGLALFYLSVNGLALFFELWNERRRKGSKALFWWN